MPITDKSMIAARLYGSEDLRVEEMEIPTIGPEDVLLKVEAAGMCSTEPHDFHTGYRRPVIPGHEYAGVIAEVGDQVRNWKVGDRVTGRWRSSCGNCPECRTGRPGLCRVRMTFGYEFEGSFAQYMRVPGADRTLVRLPSEVSFEAGVLIGCPTTTGMWGVHRAGVRVGDIVAVFGAGVVGLSAVVGARLDGAAIVICLDPLDWRRDLAGEFGANITLDPTSPDVVDEVLELTDGSGVNQAVIAAPASSAVQQAVDIMSRGGRIAIIATMEEFKLRNVDLGFIVMEKELVGVSGAPHVDFLDRVIDLFRSGRVDRSRHQSLITHRFSLSDVHRAYEIYERKEEHTMKVVLLPW